MFNTRKTLWVCACGLVVILGYLAASHGWGKRSDPLAASSGSQEPQRFRFSVGFDPRSVAAADLDGDNTLDVVVANFESDNVSVALWNGENFGPSVNVPAGQHPISVAIGDFNHDGVKDLAVANGSADNGPSSTLSILLGFVIVPGNIKFQEPRAFQVEANPRAVVVADFNGDDNQDLAVANEGSNSVSILLGNGDGTFQPAINFEVGESPRSLVAADFNGDDVPDLAVANYNSSNVTVLLLGKDIGVKATATINLPKGSLPSSITAADFNGDGLVDIAVANFGRNSIAAALNKGGGNFGDPIESNLDPGQEGPVSIAVGNFNPFDKNTGYGDNHLDLAIANVISSTGSTMLGLGDGTFAPNRPPSQTGVPTPFEGLCKPTAVVAGSFAFALKRRKGLSGLVFVGRNLRACPEKSGESKKNSVPGGEPDIGTGGLACEPYCCSNPPNC